MTVSDICRKLRISKKTFYQFYASKEEVVYNFVLQRIDASKGVMDEILSGKDFVESLLASIERFTRIGFVDPDKRTINEILKYYPETFEKRAALGRKYIEEKMYSVFAEGCRQGYVREGVNDDSSFLLMGLLMKGLTNYYEKESSNGHQKLPVKSVRAALEDFFVHALLTEKGYERYCELKNINNTK